MVRVLSFAQLRLMDAMLQMRLILDRKGLRYLPFCLADQVGETCSGEGMQRARMQGHTVCRCCPRQSQCT